MLNKISKEGRPDRPTVNVPQQDPPGSSLADRLALTMSPTVFCPPAKVEQCVREAVESRIA